MASFDPNIQCILFNTIYNINWQRQLRVPPIMHRPAHIIAMTADVLALNRRQTTSKHITLSDDTRWIPLHIIHIALPAITNGTVNKGQDLVNPLVYLNFGDMMTSSNGNIFRITGPMWGESTDHRWFETPSISSWRHSNGFVVSQWTHGRFSVVTWQCALR